jgi:general secretion pathway protein D
LTKSIKGLMLGGFSNLITTTGPDGTEITIPAISALLQLSQTSNDVNVLSAPRLLTSDNEEAEIIVGQNVPIITSRLTDTGSTGLAQSVTVERKDVALTLRFTPQVTEGNLVRLSVFQEITGVASENDSTGPTLTKRQLRNTVLAEDGKTVVLGGLIDTNVQKTEFKVPLLGDIPLLGRLFRSKGTKTRKTNLLVFITPRVIHNASEMAEVTQDARVSAQNFQTRELKRLLEEKALMTDLKPVKNTEETPAKDE